MRKKISNNIVAVDNRQLRVRSRVIALVLSIGFGYLGLDQFYLGDYGKGLIKFVTFGVFGIFWLVDIYIIAIGSVDGVKWSNHK